MILQALCEYYDRCSQDPEKALPIMGFEYKEIAQILEKDEKAIDNAMQRIRSKAKKIE